MDTTNRRGRTAVRAGALLLALSFIGCAPAPVATVRTGLAPDEERLDVSYRMECDQVSGRQLCVMVGNPLLPLKPRYPMLSLGAIRQEGGGGADPRYFLRAVYINQGAWLHIGRGASLMLQIDGDSLELSGEGSAPERFEGSSGKVFEVALYPVPPEVLLRLATAGSVSVRVKGDTVLEKHFNVDNRVYFHMFMKKAGGARP